MLMNMMLKSVECRQAPTIRRGPYKGDQLSVHHIIPRAVAPELDHIIANLELMPVHGELLITASCAALATEFRAGKLLGPENNLGLVPAFA
jgi:hypothetical protein